jgi:hypothetical protein
LIGVWCWVGCVFIHIGTRLNLVCKCKYIRMRLIKICCIFSQLFLSTVFDVTTYATPSPTNIFICFQPVISHLIVHNLCSMLHCCGSVYYSSVRLGNASCRVLNWQFCWSAGKIPIAKHREKEVGSGWRDGSEVEVSGAICRTNIELYRSIFHTPRFGWYNF